MKKVSIVCVIAIVIVIWFGVLISGSLPNTNHVLNKDPLKTTENPMTISGKQINIFSGIFGNIIIDIPIPESPHDMCIYKGYFRQGDLVEYHPGIMKPIKDPIPKDQAPEFAKKILEQQFGGLPSDAQLQYSFISYGEIYNLTTNEVEEKIPEETFVSWHRKIDGMRIEGGSDIIQVELGENGEVIRVYKSWRTYESLGNVSIISASKAIDKLAAGEVLNPSSGIEEDVSIYNIHLSYYIQGIDEPEVILEPIWVFYGNTTMGHHVPFFVYARQFASFTATPTSGTNPLTVSFTDTSDASPVKWYWDFGDSTNSTERSPSHTYTTAGSYNVSLRAWNDLGSDTMTKTRYILIGKKALVMQTGTKLDELITTLNALNLNQGMKNSLTQKIENAKAKNTDALKFIDQTKEQQANNMLNAEDNLMQAFMNEVEAQTGKAIPTDDAAVLKNRALETRELIQEAIATPI